MQASDLLPGDVLKGENYQIQDEVRSDGFLHYYAIDSDFGRFVAMGDIMVAIRIQEIGALEELSELSKMEVFADSALEAALRPVNTIKTFVEKPKETMELWTKGKVTERCRDELEEMGWKVESEIDLDES